MIPSPLGPIRFCCLGSLLAMAAGCGATCDRNPDAAARVYEGGTTEGGVYETSPFSGPYLDFPAGRTYRLVHGLGGPPKIIDPWLSFVPNPVPEPGEPREEEHSNTTPGAGNQIVVEAVTGEHIDVRNDTCSDIYLRVVASNPDL